MVERYGAPLDSVYGALASSVRRDLLDSLREGPASVTALAAPFDISLAAVAKHIDVLEAAHLASKTPVGRTRLVGLEPSPLVAARDWLETYRAFWEERLDALEAHLVSERRR
jgi:DNA-binding transcriptional ArsR family regulator